MTFADMQAESGDRKSARTRPELSVLVPVFNEADNIGLVIDRLLPVLGRCAASFEVIFIDDGSSDATLDVLRRANAEDRRIRAVSFSRNFGKEIAIAAGLDHAEGEAVVIMDADLQHPPELIESFVARWREGYKNVFGTRVNRAGETVLRRILAHRFYHLFESFGEIPLPEGAGDFRLLDRQAVEALRAMGERARFSKGLYAWIGFKSIGVPFESPPRLHHEIQRQVPHPLRARRIIVLCSIRAGMERGDWVSVFALVGVYIVSPVSSASTRRLPASPSRSRRAPWHHEIQLSQAHPFALDGLCRFDHAVAGVELVAGNGFGLRLGDGRLYRDEHRDARRRRAGLCLAHRLGDFFAGATSVARHHRRIISAAFSPK